MYHKESEAVNDDGVTFAQFMEGVDLELEGICGLSSMDLADVDYWNLWDWSCSYRWVANNVLQDNGFPMELVY